MNARGIYGMHAVNARQHARNDWPGEFVDELAEDRIFLRRAADDRDRPDRAVAMIDMLDPKHGEIMRQTIVAEMVAEGALGEELVRDDGARDAEVCVGV